MPDEIQQVFVGQYPHPNSTERENSIFNMEKQLQDPVFNDAYIHILKSAALGSNSHNVYENWKEKTIQNSRSFIKKTDWLMSVRTRMPTSLAPKIMKLEGIFFFCMGQLVGVLYVTASCPFYRNPQMTHFWNLSRHFALRRKTWIYILDPLNGTECPSQLAT